MSISKSLNSKVIPFLHNYFENSRVLIIPYFNEYNIPSNIIFDKTNIIVPYMWKDTSLININKYHFPNLYEIHFLSNDVPPSYKINTNIHTIFDKSIPYNFNNIINNSKYNNYSIDNLLSHKYIDMYSQLKIHNSYPLNSIYLHNQFMNYYKYKLEELISDP